MNENNAQKVRLLTNTVSPQGRKILKHIQRAGNITADAAITYYRIMALPRRISDLEELGFEFQRDLKIHPTTGQRYTSYSLI